MKARIEIFWPVIHVLAVLFMVCVFHSHSVIAGGALGAVPQTGQTTSYTTGDDGNFKKGVAWPTPRFTDNDDGTIIDELTGLTWMKNANCFGSTNWDNALIKVDGLNSGASSCTGYSVGTYTDWRLPNINELQDLIDLSQSNPALPVGHPFTGVQSDGYYWSSTTYAYNTSNAWYVNLDSGSVNGNGKAGNGYVWPVRGGQ